MKTTTWIIAGVLAIALILQLARIIGPAGTSSEEGTAESADSSKRVASPASSGFRVEDGHPSKGEGPRPLNIVPRNTDDADLGPPVYVTLGQELAHVNGVAITLQDLMPIPSGRLETEYVMTAARYNFLLDRAVERELTFQAAQARGVELDENQRRALAKAAERRRTFNEGKKVVDDLQDAPENAEFQQRDFHALLLQAALAENAGVPSRNVKPVQVRAYYEAHRADFETLPADPDEQQRAWAKIESEIRTKLAPVMRQKHEEHLAGFMQGLKEAAQITMASP